MGTEKRRKVFNLIFVAVLVFIAVFPFGSYFTSPGHHLENLEEFTLSMEEKVLPLMENYSIPGVGIGLIYNGEISWEEYFGYADLENRKPMTAETIFQVGSISKPVTAWGIMSLVERGEINLEDRIMDLVYSWEFAPSPFATESISVKNLLTHTGGMPIGTIGRNMEFSPGEVTPDLRDHLSLEAIPSIPPGERFHYSNPGYDLLELVIEDVLGTNFATFMAGEVLMPLGMENASFQWAQEWDSRIALGYNTRGNRVPVYVYAAKPSGGLFANVSAIAEFVLAGVNNQSRETGNLLEGDTVNRFFEPLIEVQGIYGLVSDYYGLGYYLEQLQDGRIAAFHGGQGNGWMTHFHMVPETGDGIVLLTNSQRSWPFIAEILQDWGRWRGFSPLGMEVILLGQKGLQAIINVLSFLSLVLGIRLIVGLVQGNRGLALPSRGKIFLRLVQFGSGILIISLLIWSTQQDYLFLTSVFPIRAVWLGFSLLAVSVVLILNSFIVEKRKI